MAGLPRPGLTGQLKNCPKYWLFKTLNKYIASYKSQFILLFICLIFDAAFDSVFRASLAFIINAAMVPQNYSLLVLILSLLVVGVLAYRQSRFKNLQIALSINFTFTEYLGVKNYGLYK